MGLEWEQVVIAAHDPAVLGQWWCEALGWVVVDDTSPIFEIQPQPDRLPGKRGEDLMLAGFTAEVADFD